MVSTYDTSLAVNIGMCINFRTFANAMITCSVIYQQYVIHCLTNFIQQRIFLSKNVDFCAYKPWFADPIVLLYCMKTLLKRIEWSLRRACSCIFKVVILMWVKKSMVDHRKSLKMSNCAHYWMKTMAKPKKRWPNPRNNGVVVECDTEDPTFESRGPYFRVRKIGAAWTNKCSKRTEESFVKHWSYWNA